MWWIKVVLQAVGIFLITIVVFFIVPNMSSTKATGLAVVRAYGPLFIILGVLFVAFGVFLWRIPDVILHPPTP